MKCLQCNKSTTTPCKRSDCGVTVSVATAQRLARIETAKTREPNTARHHFRDNFDKVAAWSESKGWMKPADRPLHYRAASETDRGKIVIQAIARSL